jgi:hypothetical protein
MEFRSARSNGLDWFVQPVRDLVRSESLRSAGNDTVKFAAERLGGAADGFSGFLKRTNGLEAREFRISVSGVHA